jgi:hypothetical protein
LNALFINGETISKIEKGLVVSSLSFEFNFSQFTSFVENSQTPLLFKQNLNNWNIFAQIHLNMGEMMNLTHCLRKSFNAVVR